MTRKKFLAAFGGLLIALAIVASVGAEPIPGGFRFTEAGVYSVVDEGGINMYTAFIGTGGVERWGYPISRRFVRDGFIYQAFQRGLIQWRPELNTGIPANTMDQLTAAGRDNDLHTLGIPRPIGDDGSGGNFENAKTIRRNWLTNPAIRSYYLTNPANGQTWSADAAMDAYGLPASMPENFGAFTSQRMQRGTLQLWTASVPGMPAPGTVVGVLAGDFQKQFGLIPVAAATPENQTVPVTPPQPSLQFPTATIDGVSSNCGVTDFRGRLVDPNGNGVGGIAVRLRSQGGGFETLSALSDGSGNWDIVLNNVAVANAWEFWVDVNNTRQSPILAARTDGPDKCAAGSGGVQSVRATFSQAGSSGAAPAPTAVAPAPTPQAGNFQYPTALVTGTNSNCGVTDIRGRLEDAGGNPISGVAVRVKAAGGGFETLSNLSVDGNWDVVLDSAAKVGDWTVNVDLNNTQASPIVNVHTDGPDRCAQGSGGVQSVRITFRRSN